ncbi:MAG: AAA family ATPase, partial [Gammaproteobacteria bacterium]|nr:AAA family ATPase [Gammaproteobacteria bacterium]
MAVKTKSVFSCTECGAQASKWSGQCPGCSSWNTLVETVAVSDSNRSGRLQGRTPTVSSQSLDTVALDSASRFSTGLVELDRVLGGGMVVGSVVLIGGDPGIGKSTLLIQALTAISQNAKVLYITGEESAQQIALRADRLGLKGAQVRLLAENHIETILSCAAAEQPQMVVIDSIQTVFTELLQSAPGSVAQVRESAAQLVRFAKHNNTGLFLVGHVTKEGTLAGPRVLEHMVDTV